MVGALRLLPLLRPAELPQKSGNAYTYYYWNPRRNTDREGERIKLPDAIKHPARFFAEVEPRRNSTPTSCSAGSIGDLVTRYRASDEFKRLSEGTQSNYEVHVRRFEAHDTWGMVAVRDLAPITVQTARDAMEETAVMAKPDAVGRLHYLGLGDSAGPRQIQPVRQGERLRYPRPRACAVAVMGDRLCPNARLAGSGPHDAARRDDLPARQRSHQDGARAPRPRWPLVSLACRHPGRPEGKNGLSPRSGSTIGISSPTTLTIRPSDHPRPARHRHPGARRARLWVDQIANDIGMSRQDVEH